VHREVFIELRQRVNDLIYEAKTNHFKGLLEEHKADTKQLFRFTNNILGRNSVSPLPSGTDSDIADMFSEFFIEKILRIRDSIPSDNVTIHIPPPVVEAMIAEFQSVTENEVIKLIKSCANKHCDLDPMPTSLVKLALPQLSPLVTSIMNTSIKTGVYPSSYKQALVTPLLKKPKLDPELCKNYRPVSNLGFLSKILEKVVAAQLDQHLTRNGLHEPYQSAYRAGHSTETTMLRLYNDVVIALGEKKVVLLVMLDLSAAFDTVNYKCLLSILHELGVRGTVLQWFESYLHHRQQKINIKGTRSDSKELSCGVPQGSVLGPILFNIYTSSLGRLLRQQLPLYQFYADDSELYLCVKPSQLAMATTQIEDCVGLIQAWMCKHQLKMNDEKTEFMVISSKHMAAKIAPQSLAVGGHHIAPSPTASSLGVLVDSNANMEAHINNICKGAYIQLRNIGKLKRYLSQDSLELVIHAFVTTKLDYCNSLLCGLPATLISRLQRVQNAAARILTGSPRHCHTTPLLRALHWLPVEKRVEFKILLLVYKALHGDGPAYLQDLITPHVPARKLRSVDLHLVNIPFTSSSLVQSRAFSVAGPRLWNSLPCAIRSATSIVLFKKNLKTHLFIEAYAK